MALTLNELKVRVKYLNDCFAELKSRIFLVIGILALFLVYKSHQSQHRELVYLRNSISKLYKDFDARVLTDVAAMREYVEKLRQMDFPMIELDEIQKASQNVESQIETLKHFDQDKTGKVDLALENSGARIAGLGPSTQLFYSCNVLWKAIGCPNKVNGPEKLIQPPMHPGECFRFKGKAASVFIRLIGKAILDSVTVEHIPKKMSPTGEVKSAPRMFSVSGINKKDDKPFLFGNFTFNANKTSIQTFKFPSRAAESHRYVRLDFVDNNGNEQETCVYRVRIHGVLDTN